MSTPNCPGSLMENISKEPEDSCIYRRLYMDYHYLLNKNVTFLGTRGPLKFAGKIGNLLSQKIIDSSISLGEQLSTKHIEPNPYAIHSLGCDQAFGSSAFGLVLTEYLPEHDIIRVLYAEQFDNHPSIQAMIDLIFNFHREYFNLWIPIDAVNRGFITSLKIAFSESINYEHAEDVLPSNNIVLPVNFSKEGKSMISHLAQLFNEHKVAVDPQFDKLIIALRYRNRK